MPDATVSVLKFVGTVSLGLLTGVSYATSTQSLPALHALPSAAAANVTFRQHLKLTTRHLSGLTAVSALSYLLAYTLSPGRRHPYLLYVCTTVGIGAGVDALLGKREADVRRQAGNETKPYVEEEDYEDVNGSVRVNGEEVRKSMESFRSRQLLRTGISGVAFLLGVVGLWGDVR